MQRIEMLVIDSCPYAEGAYAHFNDYLNVDILVEPMGYEAREYLKRPLDIVQYNFDDVLGIETE